MCASMFRVEVLEKRRVRILLFESMPAQVDGFGDSISFPVAVFVRRLEAAMCRAAVVRGDSRDRGRAQEGSSVLRAPVDLLGDLRRSSSAGFGNCGAITEAERATPDHTIFTGEDRAIAACLNLRADLNLSTIASLVHGEPPKNGEIALWPNTRVVKCKYCVSKTK